MTLDYEAINATALKCAQSALDRLSKKPPGVALFSAISGGHMYGFPSPDSDLDIRGCHVLPADLLFGLRDPKETFELMGEWVDGVEIDWVSHDLKKYLKLLMKNGGYILEQIFSPLVVCDNGHLGELQELASTAMTRHVYHHYHGFYRKQREAVATESTLRAKSVLYLFRVVMTGTHLLRTGEVETDIKVLNEDFAIPALPALWTLKGQEHEKTSLDESQRDPLLNLADQLHEQMEAAVETSPLPVELQNFEALEDFLLRMRREFT